MAEMAAAEDMAGAELGEITTIQLIANPWNGSAANIAVAAQLLEHIGYEVEVTDLDENAQWSAINTGDLHASLEVWPSGHADNRADFIDNPDGNVVDAGLLGPIGKIGWWMPAYMVDQYPALATAEGFTDPELAGLFATAETGEAGQILHGDPSWVTFEQDIIDDLGLHLEIVYAGSEEALLAAFDGAFAREEPVLAYFWTPHVAFSSFDLVELELPLDPDGNKYYPPDNLFKIVWAGLEEGAPAAWSSCTTSTTPPPTRCRCWPRSRETARASRKPRRTGSPPTRPLGAPGSRRSGASSGLAEPGLVPGL